MHILAKLDDFQRMHIMKAVASKAISIDEALLQAECLYKAEQEAARERDRVLQETPHEASKRDSAKPHATDEDLASLERAIKLSTRIDEHKPVVARKDLLSHFGLDDDSDVDDAASAPSPAPSSAPLLSLAPPAGPSERRSPQPSPHGSPKPVPPPRRTKPISSPPS